MSFVISRESEPSFMASEYNYEVPQSFKEAKKPAVWQEFSLNLLKVKHLVKLNSNAIKQCYIINDYVK